jgi:hypothetical protein
MKQLSSLLLSGFFTETGEIRLNLMAVAAMAFVGDEETEARQGNRRAASRLRISLNISVIIR